MSRGLWLVSIPGTSSVDCTKRAVLLLSASGDYLYLNTLLHHFQHGALFDSLGAGWTAGSVCGICKTAFAGSVDTPSVPIFLLHFPGNHRPCWALVAPGPTLSPVKEPIGRTGRRKKARPILLGPTAPSFPGKRLG